ncbi:MAG: sigma-54-dependent Fis family transcriptional regulator [Acidobacteria bacterium]|nr:MAG: sigma-54-dependent Fis family transcriptional regulator [Acidobacteriota bacterium]
MTAEGQDRPRVLVVDDKRNMLRLMEKVLRGDADVLLAASAGEALQRLREERIDVVLCDLRMPDGDGIEVLRACRRVQPNAEFVLMTAYATVGTAVEALRLGAYDYLTKPVDPEQAREVVLRAAGRAAVSAGERIESLPGVIGGSEPMRRLAELVRRLAKSDATVLVLGETGTGKERIARALHQLSPRAQHPFVAVNCAAIPADLLESELFGHARGAFTGATGERAGLFERAHRGTLFLDEIAELRSSLQAKLTRALEEKAVRRLGESAERPVDVRIVAATHQDLEGMVARGTFRADLWYRLNVAQVRVPPLRDRREDIEPLAVHFLRACQDAAPARRLRGFTAAALQALHDYDWPGNVRQLRAAVERAAVVADGERVDVGDLPPEIVGIAAEEPSERELGDLTWQEAVEQGRREIARRYLTAVLRRYGGRVADAAAHAGVERESFYRLMRRYGVRVPPPGESS